MKYEQLENLLDEDLGWRKVEISDLLFLAKETQKEVVLKSVILLLYAHWEGYIKKSSKLYIKYISEKKIKLTDLCYNFKAVALKVHVSKCIETKDNLTLANELTFVSSFLKFENKKFKVEINLDNDFDSGIIDTKSNLKPKVFKNIIEILGLNYKNALKAREHYINSHLLANRNAIGHGNKFDSTNQVDFSLSIKDIEKLKTIVFSIIDNFKEELLEYIYNKYYLETNQAKKIEFEYKKEVELEKLFASIEESFA
jgi:hypothetical protein